MSASADPLRAALLQYPGIVLELDEHECVTALSEAASRLMLQTDSTCFEQLLDDASRAKWRAIPEGTRVAELLLTPELLSGPRILFISPPVRGRRLLIELPPDPHSARLRDELSALNSDLVNAQRELSKQKAQLQSAFDQLHNALEARARLSAELQSHGEELEAQNEELHAVTEQLRMQQEESSRLNVRLQEQAAELHRAMRSRERFFSAMSHELRTPLTAVLGYAHLLLDGVAGQITTQQRDFIDRTRAAAQHLNSLLDDILDLAKLDSGTLELTLEQAFIHDVIDAVVATMAPAADAARSPIHTDLAGAPEFITTDVRALRQILLNLLSNAIKFGAGEPVMLECTRIGGSAVFAVADGGVGIRASDAERIFDEFAQTQEGRRQKGTGLGLSISRQLAERLGGRLGLAPQQGRGARFVLELPVAGPSEG